MRLRSESRGSDRHRSAGMMQDGCSVVAEENPTDRTPVARPDDDQIGSTLGGDSLKALANRGRGHTHRISWATTQLTLARHQFDCLLGVSQLKCGIEPAPGPRIDHTRMHQRHPRALGAERCGESCGVATPAPSVHADHDVRVHGKVLSVKCRRGR
jgi:hypothetical protein